MAVVKNKAAARIDKLRATIVATCCCIGHHPLYVSGIFFQLLNRVINTLIVLAHFFKDWPDFSRSMFAIHWFISYYLPMPGKPITYLSCDFHEVLLSAALSRPSPNIAAE